MNERRYRIVTWVDGTAQISEHTVTNEYKLQAERALKLRSDIRDYAPTVFFVPFKEGEDNEGNNTNKNDT